MSRIVRFKKPQVARGIRSPRAQLIAVGGGKGGVGKSFVSTNLAIALAHKGFNTLVIDLDLGCANIHTCLGESLPQKGIENFVFERATQLEEIITPTKIPNLRLISGTDSDRFNSAGLDYKKQGELMSAIFNYEADYIILDLSAGTHPMTLDFFLMAQHKLVTITPEPSSIENAYRFMKASFFRNVERYQRQLNLHLVVKRLLANAEKSNIRFPSDFLRVLGEKKPADAEQLMRFMTRLNFNIVLNQTRTQRDRNIGPSVKSVCTKYFGLPATYLGHLDFDNAVWQSLRKKKPLLLDSPQSPLYAQMLGVVKNIVGPEQLRQRGAI